MNLHIKFILITIVTFVIFLMESLIHFSIGKKGNNSKEHKYINIYNIFKIHIPDKKELIKILITVTFFSLLSGICSSLIIHYHIN